MKKLQDLYYHYSFDDLALVLLLLAKCGSHSLHSDTLMMGSTCICSENHCET